jgi:hypothetical protein
MGREVNMDLDAQASAKADVPTGDGRVERREEIVRDILRYCEWARMKMASRRPLAIQVGTTDSETHPAMKLK